jgi:hypothetical protein
MDNTEKVRENRVRRAIARRGFQLVKTRRRDPNAWDYGTYMINDPRINGVVSNGVLTLDEVEDWLDETAR